MLLEVFGDHVAGVGEALAIGERVPVVDDDGGEAREVPDHLPCKQATPRWAEG